MNGIVKRWFIKRFIPMMFFLIFIASCFYIFAKYFIKEVIKSKQESYSALNLMSAFLIAEFAIALIVGLISYYFIKSIADPVKKINNSAEKIARGDFSIKIKKEHEDEIGELCNSINNMTKELAATEKMKNDFISSISHELRTPLTAIRGWAETMKDSDILDLEVIKKAMKIIVSESERLCGIVEELLDFSNIRNSKMVLNMNKLDILAELGEAIYMFHDRALQEKKLLLYLEPENFPPVFGDKNRLKQVFINIMDNALKYTDENGVINVSAKMEENFIKITVDDNGCGISKADLPKVKEKFFKANRTQIGAGIGLAIANEIVSAHDGKLEISSGEDTGTTVSVYIPVIKEGEII